MISCAVGLAAICTRALQAEEARAKRDERKKKNDLRSLADKISGMGTAFINATPPGT